MQSITVVLADKSNRATSGGSVRSEQATGVFPTARRLSSDGPPPVPAVTRLGTASASHPIGIPSHILVRYRK